MSTSMQYDVLSLGALKTNCYLLWNSEGDAYIIDPGAEPQRVLEAVLRHGITPRAILLTHAHFDHICAVPEMVAEFGVPVYLHAAESVVLTSDYNEYPPYYRRLDPPPATQTELPPALPGLAYTLLETPGHSPGGVTFYFEAAGLAVVGDAIMAGTVGRTDLPGGDWDTLMHSIREVLFHLPPSTRMLPGHGPITTVERERRSNPFVGDGR